jgi:hypothetical protein
MEQRTSHNTVKSARAFDQPRAGGINDRRANTPLDLDRSRRHGPLHDRLDFCRRQRIRGLTTALLQDRPASTPIDFGSGLF